MLAVLCGCVKQESGRFYLQEIGNFAANSAGNNLDASFSLPEGFTGSCLGLSVKDSRQQMRFPISLASNLAQLKFTLQIFEDNASNAFYQAEVPLKNNSAYYPLWRPAYGVLIGGLEPLPYAWPETRSNTVAVFRYGEDSHALESGILRSKVAYRLRLTVRDSILLTNRLHLWLYSHRAGSDMRPEQ
ncbi:MAG: hypothetical protein WCO56_00805 [Verrucomicrobiota bacterium]